jgi:hypothetical protein
MTVQRLAIFDMCYVCDKFKMPEDEKGQEWRKLDGQTIDKAEKLLTCSRCHIVQYCSEQCQKSDWKIHKVHCKPSTISFEPKRLRETVKRFFNAELSKTFAPVIDRADALVKSCYAQFNLLPENAVNFVNYKKSDLHPKIENGMYVRSAEFWTYNRNAFLNGKNNSPFFELGFTDFSQRQYFLANKKGSFPVHVALHREFKESSTHPIFTLVESATIPIANLLYTVCMRKSDPLPSTQEGWLLPDEQLKRLRAPIITPLCQWFPLDVAELVRQFIGEHPIFSDWHNALKSTGGHSKLIPPLPEDFPTIVESASPFSDQTIQDSHFLTLVCSKEGPDHWELVANNIIRESTSKFFHRQVEWLAQINQEKNVAYEIPHLESIARTVHYNFFCLGKKPDPTNKKNESYTWIQTASSPKSFLVMQYPSIIPDKDTEYNGQHYAYDPGYFQDPNYGVAPARRI